MNRYVHVLIVFSFCLTSFICFSQQSRIKSSSISKAEDTYTPAVVTSTTNNNKTSNPETKIKSAIQNVIANKAISDTTAKLKDSAGSTDRMLNKQHSQQRLVEKGDVVVTEQTITDDGSTNNKMADNNGIFQDNVTYTKESLPTDSTTTISEHKTSKVITSVNYKPKVVREDVVPASNTAPNEIAPNKKIYLQEEADDLQAEIALNRNNPNYDLIGKQKKLQQILDLLK